ncbi:DUF4389 domain-containing protein [Candidatus Peregrinibacteria bacterium]|nr:DUF4389 domain-containing protein [Candidatus Peregrinibacteria bacterium]
MEENKKEVFLEVPYREKVSRLFIFRGLWGFVMIWPLYVWMLWMALVVFVQFWYMLILGKRHEGLWIRQVRFFRHLTKWSGYFNLVVDKRPKFIED